MILINVQAWPTILEHLQDKKRVSEYDDELERSKKFVNQLDAITDFCSQVKENLKKMTEFKKGEKESDIDLKFDSDSDVDNDTHDKYMIYLNPLQLIDTKGNTMAHSFADRLKTEGYIYEQFYLKNVHKKFKLSKFNSITREEIQMCARRGRKDGKTVVQAIIPLTEDLIMVEIKYTVYGDKGKDDSDDEHDVKEMLLFRKGQIQQHLQMPDCYKSTFENLDPKYYDVYTAISAKTSVSLTMILKFTDQEIDKIEHPDLAK